LVVDSCLALRGVAGLLSNQIPVVEEVVASETMYALQLYAPSLLEQGAAEDVLHPFPTHVVPLLLQVCLFLNVIKCVE
jgi:hypothetical protein